MFLAAGGSSTGTSSGTVLAPRASTGALAAPAAGRHPRELREGRIRGGQRMPDPAATCDAGVMPEMPGSAKAFVTSRPYQLLARRIIVPWVLQGEQPAGEGLEIGAGSGAMTARLLDLFPGLRMTATDYDQDMVAGAAARLARFADRATVTRADATDLPFADERFDVVLSAAMLHHAVAWEKALAEAARVLRPGGRLVGFDLTDTAPVRLMHLGENHRIRLIRPEQLTAELGRLGMTDWRVRRGLGGLAVRFIATRPAQGR
jgi:SAM-dependent methyltransferase